jgi:hypothetical protein
MRLTVLFEYPAPEAALARPKASDPRVAERFEVYACGVELANGFGELTDAAEQRRRFTLAMDEKARRYGERVLTPSPNSVPSGSSTAARPSVFSRRAISARNRSAVSLVRKVGKLFSMPSSSRPPKGGFVDRFKPQSMHSWAQKSRVAPREPKATNSS